MVRRAASGVMSTVFAYDGAGRRLTDEEGNSLRYSPHGRLAEVVDATGSSVASWTFGSDGRRLSEVTGSGSRTRLFGPGSFAPYVVEENGEVRDQVIAGGAVLATLRPSPLSGDRSSTMQQALAAGPSLASGEDGEVEWQGRWSAWGSPTSEVGVHPDVGWAGLLSSGPKAPYGAAAMRDYDPVTGTWLQPDPLGVDGGINQYQYADGDPIGRSDPSGLCTRTLTLEARSQRMEQAFWSASGLERKGSYFIDDFPEGYCDLGCFAGLAWQAAVMDLADAENPRPEAAKRAGENSAKAAEKETAAKYHLDGSAALNWMSVDAAGGALLGRLVSIEGRLPQHSSGTSLENHARWSGSTLGRSFSADSSRVAHLQGGPIKFLERYPNATAGQGLAFGERDVGSRYDRVQWVEFTEPTRVTGVIPRKRTMQPGSIPDDSPWLRRRQAPLTGIATSVPDLPVDQGEDFSSFGCGFLKDCRPPIPPQPRREPASAAMHGRAAVNALTTAPADTLWWTLSSYEGLLGGTSPLDVDSRMGELHDQSRLARGASEEDDLRVRQLEGRYQLVFGLAAETAGPWLLTRGVRGGRLLFARLLATPADDFSPYWTTAQAEFIAGLDGLDVRLVEFPDVGFIPEVPVDQWVARPPPRRHRLRGRAVGRSGLQNQLAQQHAATARALGAADIRINQTQIAGGLRVGWNRPDLQFTLDGVQFHLEYDRAPARRAGPHAVRLLSNDWNAAVFLITTLR